MAQRDDVFHVEMLGLHQVSLSLVSAGYEVAVPRWDAGVDVIAFRSSPTFLARPLQIKAAASFGFGIYRKYQRFPGLIMTYAINLREREPIVYAMPYDVTVSIGKDLGWTTTTSWVKGGGYFARHCTDKLGRLLEPNRMTPDRWQHVLELSDST